MERFTIRTTEGDDIINVDTSALLCTLDADEEGRALDAITRLAEYEDAEEDGRYVKVPEMGIGTLSDGYHTFNELYHHRAVLFSVICNHNPQHAWKSKQHSDGTMYDGMFIIGIDTPFGPATYHYDIEPYWSYFQVPEISMAPEWDGHTPEDAITRLWNYGINPLGESVKENR